MRESTCQPPPEQRVPRDNNVWVIGGDFAKGELVTAKATSLVEAKRLAREFQKRTKVKP